MENSLPRQERGADLAQLAEQVPKSVAKIRQAEEEDCVCLLANISNRNTIRDRKIIMYGTLRAQHKGNDPHGHIAMPG